MRMYTMCMHYIEQCLNKRCMPAQTWYSAPPVRYDAELQYTVLTHSVASYGAE
jgi:hypothetical protein